MSGRGPSWCAVAALACSLIAAATASATLVADNQAFEQARDLYKRGHTEEALQKFREILAAGPSAEDALHMWDDAGHDVFMPMLLAPGEQSTIARRFAELAKVGRKTKAANPEAIKALVDQVIHGEYRAQRDALDKLIADHGAYAVEFLYEHLGNPDDLAVRVNAVYALFRLGEDAVLPLIQVLKSSNDEIRANAAGVLAKIGDTRATPALASLAAADQSEMVRGEARAALKKLEAPAGSAADLYLKQSQGYFRGDPGLLRHWSMLPVIWSWDGDKLVKRDVSPGLFPMEMARQSAMAAVALDGSDRRAQATLCAACAGVAAELQASKAAGASPPVDADATLAQIGATLGLAGRDVLADALAFTLDQNHALASCVLIEELGRLQASGPVLERALESRDKLVRHTAALTLAMAGQSSTSVVQVLVEALSASSFRTVLVIDDQDESRNAIATALSRGGMNAVTASSGAAGVERAKGFPTADAILVRSDLKDLSVDAIVHGAKGDPRLASTPILLISNKARLDDDARMYEGKIAGCVESGGSVETLVASVSGALPKAGGGEGGEKGSLSARAAMALVHVDASALGPAIDALTEVLNDRPNEVREPALWALAKIGPPKAAKGAAAIYGDAKNPKELRLAAAHALVAVLRNLTADPGAEVMGPLTEGLHAEDADLRRGAAEALGAAQFLTPAQRANLILGRASS